MNYLIPPATPSRHTLKTRLWSTHAHTCKNKGKVSPTSPICLRAKVLGRRIPLRSGQEQAAQKRAGLGKRARSRFYTHPCYGTQEDHVHQQELHAPLVKTGWWKTPLSTQGTDQVSRETASPSLQAQCRTAQLFWDRAKAKNNFYPSQFALCEYPLCSRSFILGQCRASASCTALFMN